MNANGNTSKILTAQDTHIHNLTNCQCRWLSIGSYDTIHVRASKSQVYAMLECKRVKGFQNQNLETLHQASVKLFVHWWTLFLKLFCWRLRTVLHKFCQTFDFNICVNCYRKAIQIHWQAWELRMIRKSFHGQKSTRVKKVQWTEKGKKSTWAENDSLPWS